MKPPDVKRPGSAAAQPGRKCDSPGRPITANHKAKGERRFKVVCKKTNGREVEFQSYAGEQKARSVAARLIEIGCAARVRCTASAPTALGNCSRRPATLRGG